VLEDPDLCQPVFIQWLGLLWGVLWVADWANVKGLLMCRGRLGLLNVVQRDRNSNSIIALALTALFKGLNHGWGHCLWSHIYVVYIKHVAKI